MRAAIDHDLRAIRADTARWLVTGLLLAVIAMLSILALGRSPLPGSGARERCLPQVSGQSGKRASP